MPPELLNRVAGSDDLVGWKVGTGLPVALFVTVFLKIFRLYAT